MHDRDDRLNANAKDLRRHMTDEERKLWYLFLHDYPVRFRRQVIIGQYIVDFYCHQAKLAIELDGSQHYEEKGLVYDQKRTDYIRSQNIDVLRFSNLDVARNFRGVCEEIDAIVKRRTDTE
ncbi:MAG: endonuclease domain-containing protein [Clostridia bacterium]|nr:endonuclease domain-containing protein [Clostridia bacterium]